MDVATIVWNGQLVSVHLKKKTQNYYIAKRFGYLLYFV